MESMRHVSGARETELIFDAAPLSLVGASLSLSIPELSLATGNHAGTSALVSDAPNELLGWSQAYLSVVMTLAGQWQELFERSPSVASVRSTGSTMSGSIIRGRVARQIHRVSAGCPAFQPRVPRPRDLFIYSSIEFGHFPHFSTCLTATENCPHSTESASTDSSHTSALRKALQFLALGITEWYSTR